MSRAADGGLPSRYLRGCSLHVQAVSTNITIEKLTCATRLRGDADYLALRG